MKTSPSRMTVSLFAATAALLAVASGAHAGQTLLVEKNHMARVTLAASAASVIVGNPDIADVNVVDSRTIYVIGKGFGNSAISVTGRDGRSLFDGEIVVTAGQKGGVTVYKGLKPSLMICSNICMSEDPSAGNTGQANSNMQGPAPSMAPVGGQVSGAPGAVGTAMQVQ